MLCSGRPVPKEAIQRLWKSVDKSGRCWLWTGYKKNGYGAMSIFNHPEYTHQISWGIHKGKIPIGLFVLHSCDVRACVRPSHLFLGTRLDNIRDMREKGRGSNPPVISGEDHPKATISDLKILEIRKRWSTGRYQQRELAKIYKVSQSTIWRFIHRMTRVCRA